MKPTHWEYMTLTGNSMIELMKGPRAVDECGWPIAPESYLPSLNELGKKGWEIVSVHHDPNRVFRGQFTVLLKRERPSVL